MTPKLKVEITNSSSGPTRPLANIGPRGQRQRRRFGLVALVLALVVIAGTGAVGISPLWRLGAFPLLWFGAIGLLQARARTCIAFAARGACDTDAGAGELTPADQDALRVRSKQILRLATALAIAVTVGALVLPSGW
jgi:hypothetical protein